MTDNALSLEQQARFDELYGPTPKAASTESPGAFSGIWKAPAGIPSGLSGAPLSIASAATAMPKVDAGYLASFGVDPAEFEKESNEYFKTTPQFAIHQPIEDLRQSAAELYRPDPATTGFIGNTLFGVSDVITRVAVSNLIAPGSGVGVAAGTTGYERTKDLEAQGVDTRTAVASGQLTAASFLAMGGVSSMGTSAATRAASGAASNVVFGAAQRGLDSALLEANGYHGQAEQQKWSDATSALADLVIGGAFGLLPHGESPVKASIPKDVVDASLVAKSAQNVADLAPGAPADAASMRKHLDALDTAQSQLMDGQDVQVDPIVRGATFVPRNTDLMDYAAFRHTLESGGNPEAANPASSALGIDQFTASTWLSQVAKVAPEWAQGKTKTELLAMRTDPAKSAEMVAAFDADNAAALKAAGQPVTDYTLYAAHHFGPDKAVAFSKAGDDTPMTDILSKAQIKANPYLADLTKGETVANWKDRARNAGVFPEDELHAANFGLPEPPRPLPDTSPLLTETNTIDTPERKALQTKIVDSHFEGLPEPSRAEGEKPVAYVMGGGGASGKGTLLKMLRRNGIIPERDTVNIDPDAIKEAIPEYNQILQQGDSRAAAVVHEESSAIAKQVLAKAMAGKYDLLLDRTLGDKAKGTAEIQALKDAGYEVRLYGVTIDPRLAVGRAVERAKGSGRFVPLNHLLKAHKGFAGAFEHYAKLAHRTRLFDNQVPRGENARLIADTEGGSLTVHDQKAYNRFRERSQINDEASTHAEVGPEAPHARAGDGHSEQAAAAGRNAEDHRGARGGRERTGSGTGLEADQVAFRDALIESGLSPDDAAQAVEPVASEPATRDTAPDAAHPQTSPGTDRADAGTTPAQRRTVAADDKAQPRTSLDPARVGEVERAREAVAERPGDVLDDGTTVADAMRAADEDYQQAVKEGEGIQAAIACFLRFGASA